MASSAPTGVHLAPGMSTNAGRVGSRSVGERKKSLYTVKTSRVAIARLVRGRMLRKPSVPPQSPPSPNQECAVNPRTGKVALGPWLGPYGSSADSPPPSPPPLFLDTNGNTFASLKAAGLLQQRSSAPLSLAAAEEQGGGGAASRQLHALVGKVAQRRAVAAAAGQARPLGKRSGRGAPSSGRCGSVMARNINQPR